MTGSCEVEGPHVIVIGRLVREAAAAGGGGGDGDDDARSISLVDELTPSIVVVNLTTQQVESATSCLNRL